MSVRVPDDVQRTDLTVTKLFDNRRVVVGRCNHPMRDARTLADLADAEWMTTSITREAPDELRQVFADAGLTMPRLLYQAQSALSALVTLIQTDALAMMPVQWVEAPVVDGWLSRIPLEEDFSAPPIMLVQRTGLGTTPAGEYFLHLVQQLADREGAQADTQTASLRKF